MIDFNIQSDEIKKKSKIEIIIMEIKIFNSVANTILSSFCKSYLLLFKNDKQF